MRDRRHHRIEVNLDVACTAPGETPFHAIAKDMSLGGMFIKTDEKIPLLTNVVITFDLPNLKESLEIPAFVSWYNDEGFGVSFKLIGAKYTFAILEYIDQNDIEIEYIDE